MLSKKIEDALNAQVHIEAMSSHYYLAMAAWAENEKIVAPRTFDKIEIDKNLPLIWKN